MGKQKLKIIRFEIPDLVVLEDPLKDREIKRLKREIKKLQENRK